MLLVISYILHLLGVRLGCDLHCAVIRDRLNLYLRRTSRGDLRGVEAALRGDRHLSPRSPGKQINIKKNQGHCCAVFYFFLR